MSHKYLVTNKITTNMQMKLKKECFNCNHHYKNGLACDAKIRCSNGSQWLPKSTELQQADVSNSVCEHHYTDWDGMSDYAKCKNCGERVKAN